MAFLIVLQARPNPLGGCVVQWSMRIWPLILSPLWTFTVAYPARLSMHRRSVFWVSYFNTWHSNQIAEHVWYSATTFWAKLRNLSHSLFLAVLGMLWPSQNHAISLSPRATTYVNNVTCAPPKLHEIMHEYSYDFTGTWSVQEIASYLHVLGEAWVRRYTRDACDIFMPTTWWPENVLISQHPSGEECLRIHLMFQ